MEAPHQDAIPDQVGPFGGHALIIILQVAAGSFVQARVIDCQVVAAEAGAKGHDLLELLVLVDIVALAQVAKGLMGEDPRQLGIDDDGVLTALDHGGVEEVHRLLAGVLNLGLQAQGYPKVIGAAETGPPRLGKPFPGGHR